MKSLKLLTALAGLSTLLFLSSCGLFYKDESEDDYNLFIIGQKSQMEGEYRDAKKVYEKLIEEYPDSNLRAKAILGLADAEFNNGDYLDAEFQYQKFIELYPSHEHIDKAYFYKGMSHYQQMTDIDRDISQTQKAHDAFSYLLQNYPESPYTKEAKAKKEECHKRLGESVMAIAKFYFDTGEYSSAISRCIEYVSNYSDGDEVDYALYMLGESNKREGNNKKAKYWYETLIQNFPDSDYAAKSKSILEDIAKQESK